MNYVEFDQMMRWRRTAQTWIRKASLVLYSRADEANVDVRAVIGYEAASLVTAMLYECEALVELLDAEEFEDVDKEVKKLASQCRARRLAEKLKQVNGRTPEESATFKEVAERFVSR